jgi:hypothetical protein
MLVSVFSTSWWAMVRGMCSSVGLWKTKQSVDPAKERSYGALPALYAYTCSYVFRHYTSPRGADSQANDHLRTTEAISPYWRVASRLLPVEDATWDENPRRATANRKASESWGEAWQCGDPACERRHLQPDPLRSQSRNRTINASSFFAHSRGRLSTVIMAFKSGGGVRQEKLDKLFTHL